MKIFGKLFWSFFKVGLFTFGGGYAMIPLLQAEIVKKQKWISDEDLMDYFSIGQCTPGIIAVNVATFSGYKMRGIGGAVAATMGIVMPSVILISLIALILQQFMDNEYVMHAFAGIRVVVVALIAETLISFAQKGITNKTNFAVFVVSAGLLMGCNLSPVLVVLLAVGFGIGLQKWSCK